MVVSAITNFLAIDQDCFVIFSVLRSCSSSARGDTSISGKTLSSPLVTDICTAYVCLHASACREKSANVQLYECLQTWQFWHLTLHTAVQGPW